MSEQVKLHNMNDCQPGELYVTKRDYDALHAEAEALRAENERLTKDCSAEMFLTMTGEVTRLRTELEAARGLLEQCALSAETLRIDSMAHAKHAGFSDELVSALRKMTGVISGHGVGSSAYPSQREAINAIPAPEVQSETLDDRLKQAGMLSVAELLKGAPLDAFIKHAGVHDLATLLQWAEMRRGECLRMMARYDLGEKDKGDDLYEWTVAHCAVFTELHVNLRAVLAEQGERQEAVAWALANSADEIGGFAPIYYTKEGAISWANGRNIFPLYTTPQPGPDVRGLASFAMELIDGAWKGGSFDGGDIQEAGVRHGLLVMEQREESCGEHCDCAEYGFPAECYRLTPDMAAHRRAQRTGDSHDR